MMALSFVFMVVKRDYHSDGQCQCGSVDMLVMNQTWVLLPLSLSVAGCFFIHVGKCTLILCILQRSENHCGPNSTKWKKIAESGESEMNS